MIIKPKLNQPDVESTTTFSPIEQQEIVDFKRLNINTPIVHKFYGELVPKSTKRTEEELLMALDYEGYQKYDEPNFIRFSSYIKEKDIIISKKYHSIEIATKSRRNNTISFTVFKLLHELFDIWGWFDE